MNTKLLRQKILDLAIRGKLTDQRKSDGTAADLLKEIAAESPLLRPSKRGSNPQQKEITPLDKSEAPFEIPDNWECVRLGDLCNASSGKTPSTSQKEFWNGNILWVTSKDVKQKYIDSTQICLSDLGASSMQLYPPKTMIIVGRSGILRHSLPVAILKKGATINQDLKALVFKDDRVVEFVYSVIKGMEQHLLHEYKKAGTTVDNLNFDLFLTAPIPLPPLAEQQRIVAKIEEIFAEIDTVEKNKELLKTHIKQTRQKILDLAIHGKLVPQDENDEPASVLLEKILQEKTQSDNKKSSKKNKTTTPATSDNRPYEKFDCDEKLETSIPSKWTSCFLGDVISVINGKNQSAVENADGLYPIYGSGGIMGRADDYLCPENCTIIGRKGSINNPIFVSEKFWNVDTAFGLCPSSAILAKYLFFFCLYFDFSSLDSSTTLPSLTKTNIQQIKINLPPLAEQKRIVNKVEEIFKSLDEISLHLV